MKNTADCREVSGSFRYRGLTLVELTISLGLSVVITLALGALMVGGNWAWGRTYDVAHNPIRVDADRIMAAFGTIGRKSNRTSYNIYAYNNGRLSLSLADGRSPEQVVSGDAVEFRYWDVELDATDSRNLLDVSKLATAYALFYLDGEKLKVDYGPYPPGAIPSTAQSAVKNSSGVRTVVLAENASAAPGGDAGAFSHTTINGVGQGSVRINIRLTDPDTNAEVTVTSATFLRNIWPR